MGRSDPPDAMRLGAHRLRSLLLRRWQVIEMRPQLGFKSSLDFEK
jgi:hypothetical protein